MKRKGFISRRMRMRLALLAAFAMLFQQCAFAAYFCAVEVPPATMDCAHMAPAQNDIMPMCSHHCARATPAPLPDAQAPSVPAMLLLPFPAMTHVAVTLPQLSPALCRLPHPSPPITSLYCSRQI
jgi:hypothetical protein